MKKLFWTGFAVLLALTLVTCEMSPLGGWDDGAFKFDKNGNLESVSAVISTDGRMVFPAPSRSNRALNDAMAKSSYDLFEVVFYAQTGATTYQTARTIWGYGESGIISGVYRTTAGIDYTNADIDEVAAVGDGAAVLFIGNRKTGNLLAVGILSHIDGEPVDSTNLLKDTSTTVTFTVTSLEAGIAFNSLGDPTTTEPSNTATRTQRYVDVTVKVETSDTTGIHFRGFYLTNGVNTGNYSFSFKGLTPTATISDPINVDIINRFAAIRVRDEDLAKIVPRANVSFVRSGRTYTLPAEAIAPIVTSSFTSLTTDEALTTSQYGTVGYSITAVAAPITGLNSFTYGIPVYAITTDKSVDSIVSYSWVIMPGQSTQAELLDDNTDTALGGSVLVVIGQLPIYGLQPQDTIMITKDGLLITNF